MSFLGATFPGNVFFTGTVTSPQFVSNQQVLAPIATGTASTLTMGSITGTFCSITNTAFASTINATTGRLGSLTFGTFVGIGNSSPAYALDVSGQARMFSNGAAQVTVKNSSTSNTSDACEVFFDRSTGTVSAISAMGVGAGGRGAYWWVNNADRMNINAVGQVGINTSNPAYTLDIAGTVRCGTLTNTTIGTNAGFMICHSLTSFVTGGAYNSIFDFNYTGPSQGNTNSANTGPFPGGRLTINDDNFGAAFRWQSKIQGVVTNSLAERFTILGSGNVGIANASPSYVLDVAGNCRVVVQSSQVTGTMLTLSSTLANRMMFVDETATGSIGCSIRMTSGWTSQISTGGHLALMPGSGSFVGVNTTTPNYMLDVAGIGNFSGTILSKAIFLVPGTIGAIGAATTTDTVLGFSRLTGGGATTANLYGKVAWYGYQRTTPSAYISADSNGGFDDIGWLRFGTGNGGGGSAADKMVINNSGQVGIGTTTPAYLLDVAGTRRDNNRLAAFKFTYPNAVSIASGSTEILFTGTQAPYLPANSAYVVNTSGRIQVNVSGLWQFTFSFGFDYNAAGSASSAANGNATRAWMSQSTTVLTTPDPANIAACFTAWEGAIPAFGIQTCSGYVTCAAGTYIQAYINTLAACKSYGWSNYQACSYITGNLISAN